METTLSKEEILEKIAEVSSFLEDEQSRKILEIRKEKYYGTKPPRDGLLNELLYQSSPNCRSFHREYLNQNSVKIAEKFNIENKPVVFYGLGELGEKGYYEALKINPRIKDKEHFFCDRRAEEVKTFLGKKVISPEELLADYRESYVVINSRRYADEICEFLILNGFLKENILRCLNKHDHEGQYFDEEIIQFGEHEVFADVGVLDADTSIRFVENCNGKYDKIFLFEPNVEMYELAEKNLKEADILKYQMFSHGLWHQKENIYFGADFYAGGFGVGRGKGDIELSVDTMDHLLGDERVTFIKMDIEGSELNALKGCENIIQKYKPKLAISLYHKAEDIYEIPLLIRSLVPEYKFYIRHYSDFWYETILYAVL